MPGDLRSFGQNTGFLRPVALVLMVAGVAGFIAARILYGEQVLCMFGSSLPTFLGLAIILYLRKNNPQPLNSAQKDGTGTNQWEAVLTNDDEPVRSAHHAVTVSLVDLVTNLSQQQGARVRTETRRPDRSILIMTLPDGNQYTTMIHEGAPDIDVSELRALLALVSNHNSQLGYFVTDGHFTPRSQAWAAGKPLKLVEKGRLGALQLGR